jgi:hypothetical protein
MENPWTREHVDILRTMREEGCSFEEISEHVPHTPKSCQRAATDNGIYKPFRAKPVKHTGVTDDGPEMYHRANGRPMAKKYVLRPCIIITCKKMFWSWDRTKNQICPKCSQMTSSPYAF